MNTATDFRHLRLSMAEGDVVHVEVMTQDLMGPEHAQELGAELAMVLGQDWAKRLLVDFRRTRYLSSTGFAMLFKLVSQAKQSGHQVKFCNMDPDVRVGADILGLGRLVEIHDSENSALRSFLRA